MNSRERVLAAAERRRPDRPPTSIRFTAEALALMQQFLGVGNSEYPLNEVLDALDIDEPAAGGYVLFPVYFSLDSAFADPLETWPPCNSGSAAANGFVGGDVLVTVASGMAPV